MLYNDECTAYSCKVLTSNETGAPVVHKGTSSSDGNQRREDPIGYLVCIH